MGRDKAGWITDAHFAASIESNEGLSIMHQNLLGSLKKAKQLKLIAMCDEEDARIQAYKEQVQQHN